MAQALLSAFPGTDGSNPPANSQVESLPRKSRKTVVQKVLNNNAGPRAPEERKQPSLSSTKGRTTSKNLAREHSKSIPFTPSTSDGRPHILRKDLKVDSIAKSMRTLTSRRRFQGVPSDEVAPVAARPEVDDNFKSNIAFAKESVQA
jgi:hypothetical protein